MGYVFLQKMFQEILQIVNSFTQFMLKIQTLRYYQNVLTRWSGGRNIAGAGSWTKTPGSKNIKTKTPRNENIRAKPLETKILETKTPRNQNIRARSGVL